MKAREKAERILARFRDVVDAEILRALEQRPRIPLYEMLRYHLGLGHLEAGTLAVATGKRVRAALCCLSCEAVGGEAEAAAPAAAAVELIHSFTLLHDDVADGDATRRGRPTVWKRWGVAQAITAGDALFSLADLVAAKLIDRGVPPAETLAVVAELNAATLALCEGQQMDIAYEGRADIAVDDYLAMVARKTGALMAAACGVGAHVAGGPVESANALRDFGQELGVAFQITDDILGLWGTPSDLGKPVGSDLKRNKRSLPVVHALSVVGDAERSGLAAQLAEGVTLDEEAARIAARMEAVGSQTFCEETAQQFLARALSALDSANLQREPREQLRAVATYLTERTQ
jgi:geranylgeranyl diphosphate synthase type I